MTTIVTGLLCWRDFHPLEWQLASLHRILAYITGTVDQELLLRNEYLAAENRILMAKLNGRLCFLGRRTGDARRDRLSTGPQSTQ
jgi:hypothetical protein